MVLYAIAACCVSFTLGNAASFIFVVSVVNLGNRLRAIILDGGYCFLFFGCGFCIGLSNPGGGLSTLGYGMVLVGNDGAVWDILFLLFTWCSSPKLLLVSRYV